jgi:alkanesulfonate monooxygenase SsuD/methylene tetrahydromethanopterin reductase-like flavin-dependent oxidoreductase (luciferase family)
MIERFGVTIDWRGASLEALTTIALQADHSGCGYMWVPEAWGLEAFSTIGHLLSITKRIKIGTGIVNVFSRSAGTIAMGCSTFNQLAPQRFLLGLGTSGRGLVEDFHGVRYEKGLKRTEEYVSAIKKIESGEQIDYAGDIVKLARFRLFTAPVKPPTQIYLGAIGEKNLTLAGRIADGAIVTLYPMSKLAEAQALVNQDSGSGSKKKKVFAYFPLRLTRNEREEASAKSELARFISFYIASMGKYYAKNLSRLGYGKQVEEILGAVSTGASTLESSKKISDEFLDDFAFIGTPSKILDRVVSIPDGIYPVFAMSAISPGDGDTSAKSIRELSSELASKKPRTI